MTTDIFLSIFVGIQLVMGVGIISLLIYNSAGNQTVLSKVGLLLMAVGLIGRAAVSISEVIYNVQILPYIWALKDIGISIFAASLIIKWIDDSGFNKFGKDRRRNKE